MNFIKAKPSEIGSSLVGLGPECVKNLQLVCMGRCQAVKFARGE